MTIFLTSAKDSQIQIVLKQELYISMKHKISFFIIGQYKLPFKFKSFLGVLTRRYMEPSPSTGSEHLFYYRKEYIIPCTRPRKRNVTPKKDIGCTDREMSVLKIIYRQTSTYCSNNLWNRDTSRLKNLQKDKQPKRREKERESFYKERNCLW